MLRTKLFLAGLAMTVVVLAGLGMCQVIVGQEQPPDPTTLTEEDLSAIREANAAQNREAAREFINEGGDPCTLPVYEVTGTPSTPYKSLPSVINDADSVILGTQMATSLELPGPTHGAANVLMTVRVEEVLRGDVPIADVLIDSGQDAVHSQGELIRTDFLGLDPCAPGQVLLFLEYPPPDGEVYSLLGLQGWLRIADDKAEGAPDNGVFEDYSLAEDLMEAVRETTQQQEAQGLPEGVLVCRDQFPGVPACPGDTLNPYRDLQLDAVRQASVGYMDPEVGSATWHDLGPADPQLASLLSALDTEVTVDPLGFRQPDTVTFTVITTDDGLGSDFFYSPSAGTIRTYGGQFSAPPAFQEAMASLIASD